MSVTFGASGTYVSGTNTSHTPGVPSGVIAGSVVVLVAGIGGTTNPTITLPSGFEHAPESPVLINEAGGGDTQNHLLVVAWKRATGAESGTYTLTLGASRYVEAQAHRYEGCVGSGSPFDSDTATAGTDEVDTTASPAVSITTTDIARLLLHAATNWTGGAWTPSTGFTERMDGGTFRVAHLAEKAQAAAGASGSVTATCAGSGNTQAWLGALVPSGTPVLVESAHNLLFDVQVAWGADLTDTDGSSWVWTSIVGDVLVDGGEQVTYTLGSQNEASVSQPAECRVRLDNRAGDYSLGPQASNWPNVKRGTPLRVCVSGDVNRTIYSGFVDSWQPDWDLSGQYAVVNVTASGVLRRLHQGRQPVLSAIRRAMRNLIGTNLIGYWPMEDAKDAIYCASDIPGHPPLAISDRYVDGVPKFADAAPFACSAPIVSVDYTRFEAPIAPHTTTGELQVRFLVEFPKQGMNDNTRLLRLDTSTTSGGEPYRWYLTYGVGGTLEAHYANLLGGGATGGAGLFDVDGLRLRVGLSLRQDGADVDWEVSTYAPGAAAGSFTSGTFTGTVLRTATLVSLMPNADGDPICGHLTVQNDTTSIFTDLQQLNAYSGEGAIGRVGRLCSENGIEARVFTDGSDGAAMGAQSVASVLDLLRECEIADQGALYDGIANSSGAAPALAYLSHNQAVNVGSTPFGVANGRVRELDIVDDDQRLRNRVTVSRTGGGTITAEDTDGPLGTATVGVYDDSVTVNCEDDTQLPDYAGWLVHLGTVEGYRFPRVVMDLRDLNSSQVSHLLGSLYPIRRIDLQDLADYRTQLPDVDVQLAPYGWTASVDKHRWTYELTCGPYEPYRVVVLEDSEFYLRVDTADSTLASDASAGATSLSVATSTGALWSTDSGDYPATIEVGDLPVTVSAVSGASSPQTFTCSAIALARSAGVTVQLPRSTPVTGLEDDSGD